MASIDNAYLLLALAHGITYTGIFALFLGIMMLRLVQAGLKADSRSRVLFFTLAGIFVMFAISLGTVWMPPATEAVVFLFAGWAEGRIIERPGKFEEDRSIPRVAYRRFEQVYT